MQVSVRLQLRRDVSMTPVLAIDGVTARQSCGLPTLVMKFLPFLMIPAETPHDHFKDILILSLETLSHVTMPPIVLEKNIMYCTVIMRNCGR